MSSVSCLMAKRATLHLMDALVSRDDRSFVCMCMCINQLVERRRRPRSLVLVLAATDRRLDGLACSGMGVKL
ncbi:hypothetical protein NFJ02_31g79340 [Pycnococcus provasolii]